MATASLTDGPTVQLTFPWALPKAEEAATIVAERRSQSADGRHRRGRGTASSHATVVARVTVERHSTDRPVAKVQPSLAVEPLVSVATAASASVTPVAVSPAAVTVTPAAVTPVAADPVAVASATAVAAASECANSVQEALCGDRIGKPVRVGAVMFRLLKRYGITDEEIAEGIASYHAKRNASSCA